MAVKLKKIRECRNIIMTYHTEGYYDLQCKKNKKKQNPETISEKIIALLKMQDFNSRDIQKLTKLPKDDVIFALQNLLESDIISIKSNNLYSLKKLLN